MTLVFWLMAAGMLAASAYAASLRIWPLTIIILALCWDNAIIAAGALVGAGDLLVGLSVPRYVAHGLLTPLLIPIVFWIARLRLSAWVWVLTALLVALGAYTEIFNLNLVLKEYGGTLRYAHAAASPPIPSIVTVLVLIGVGALLWRRAGVPWLCLGALAMFGSAGSGVFWLGNAGELMLIGSILATATALRSKAALAR